MMSIILSSYSYSSLRSDERKASAKRTASRTFGTVQRALQQLNTAIAENFYSQVSFARLQVNVAREV